jgi:excinuclease ABC subunit B
VRYLHSDIDTLERVEILRELRRGTFDVLIGINLLREGLDLPEVSLVAILDADKEGYLRSERSLIQTIGRAARHLKGTVIMYADKMTDSMNRAISETARRRRIQSAYNEEHNITPQSIKKAINSPLVKVYDSDYSDIPIAAETEGEYLSAPELAVRIEQTRREMKQAAAALEFEQAALLRDRLQALEQRSLGLASGAIVAVPVVAVKPDKPVTVRSGATSQGAAGRRGGKAAARGRMARWQK